MVEGRIRRGRGSGRSGACRNRRCGLRMRGGLRVIGGWRMTR